MSDTGPDLAQLDEAQQSALATYLSVTNQDPTAAIPLLQRSQWNVQVGN
jgi:FAS-associated factor 2